MKNSQLPIPLYEISFLQAYLYEFFSLEGECSKNFNHTTWHLKQKYNDEQIETVINFFRSRGITCDCDILHKFDLKEISKDKINFHERDLKI